MKQTGAWFVLALFVLTAPIGGAQDSSEFPASETDGELDWILIGTDPEDDNDYNEGTAAEADSGRPANDLRALYVAEGPQGEILFRLHTSALPSPSDCTGAVCQYGYSIEFKLWEYDMEININDPQGEDDGFVNNGLYAYMYLRHRTENSFRSEYLGEVPVVRNEEDFTYIATMPRELVTDPQGRLLQAGTEIHSFLGYSYFTDEAGVATFGIASIRDRMPDDGTLPGTYTTTFGVTSSGHLEVFSPLPLRTSNGEATTFFFEVEVTSNADFFDTVHPEWSGGLDTWTVTFPDGPVRLEPGESRSLPFLVTVPFSHEHGAYHPFTVSFQSQADPEARGNVELGIRYTNIPQPAGHHPEVYLHEPEGRSFFNTVDDVEVFDEEQQQQTTGTQRSSGYSYCGGGQARAIPMSPALSMGLDFNMEEVGEATWVVSADQDADGYVYSGAFVVSPTEPDECGFARGEYLPNTVAIVQPTEPVSVSGGSTAEYTSVIEPTEFGDYVEFDEQNQLWLMLRLTSEGDGPVICCPDDFTFQTQLEEGTKFFLPLNEYHDDVDDYFAELSGIDLYVINNTQERYVNPGETIIYRIQATNVGVLDAEFDLEITGTHTEWATLLGDLEIELDAGETRELAIAIKAPSSSSSAPDGEVADIVLHATLVDDESIRSIIRLVTEVDTDEDHPDQTAEVTGVDEELQQTPAPLLPILAALGATALLHRRRHG